MTQFVLQVASHQLIKVSNPSAGQMKRGQTLLSYKHLEWEGGPSAGPVLVGLESSSLGRLWLTSAANNSFVAEWQANTANISERCSEQRL